MKGFPGLLKQEIDKGLPGTEVQWKMASSDRKMVNYPRSPGLDAKPASVLILLYPLHDTACTVFMQRPEYEGVHSGQISFPGGKREPSDTDAVETALREAREETGIDTTMLTLLGTLTPLFIYASNTLVTPVVAWSDIKPEFRHQAEEVEYLFEGNIRSFLNPSVIKEKPFRINEGMISIRYFDYEGHVIWGATAMMLNELLELIRRAGLYPPG
jgi:8-oxo-dGTP pyrophosphatase MutT (NUDIX family)